MTQTHPKPRMLRVWPCVWLLALMPACDSRESAPPTQSDETTAQWVARGPSAWAERLAPRASIDEDGFPKLSGLARWLADNPADAIEPGEVLEWAEAYAEIVRGIAIRRAWSAKIVYDEQLLVYGERIGSGIGAGDLFVSNQGMIDVVKGGEAAFETLRAAGRTDDAAALARALIGLGERIGRNDADREHMIAILQVGFGSKGVSQLGAIADDEGSLEKRARFEEILREIRAYGDRLVRGRLGGG